MAGKQVPLVSGWLETNPHAPFNRSYSSSTL